MSRPDERTDTHLRILSVFYFVKSGLMLLGSCSVGVWLLAGGAMIATAPQIAEKEENISTGGMQALGAAIMVGGAVVLVLQLIMVVLDLLAGMHLHRRRGRTLCMVAAAIACIGFPIGTALGVYTFIILGRPEVKRLFEAEHPVPDS